MKPVANYLLLEVKKEEPSSIIFTPEQYRKREKEGIVLDVGRHVEMRPVMSDCVKGTWVDKLPEKGDRVYFTAGGVKNTEWGLVVPSRNIFIL